MLIQRKVIKLQAQQGVGLIEVLIAVLILTVGILGMVGLQVRTLQFSQETLLSSQAQMLAYELTDQIRANRTFASSYAVNYGETVTATANCSSASCTPAQMALYDLSQWKANVLASLPGGDCKVERDTSGTRPFFTISVRFQDTKLDKALAGGTGADTYREVSIRTEI